jgi:glycosyltransferase involved in cell wall biosynthesis
VLRVRFASLVKALFVINNPGFGGGYSQIVRLREPLAALGWDVAMVAPQGAEATARLRAGGVEVLEIPLHRLRASPDPRLQAPFLARFVPEVSALRRLFVERGVDVVQPHGDTNPHAGIAAHRAGIAVCWEIYDTRTPVPLRRLTMPVVTRLADSIMTVGRALGHAYPGTERLGERWVPIWPPVDGAAFVPDPARRLAARRELGIPEDAVAVGAIGMLNPSKGFEFFVRALGSARAQGAPVVGRILGGASPAHAAYGESIRAEARALGLLDGVALDIRDGGTRVAELMPGLDVLALSSVPRSEGVPTVILEAMSSGLPVVASDVGAVAEAVADGETGYVIAPEDADLLSARLVQLAGDPALRARLGAAGAARFAREFTIEDLARRYVHAYELALAHRAAR